MSGNIKFFQVILYHFFLPRVGGILFGNSSSHFSVIVSSNIDKILNVPDLNEEFYLIYF
ncbi:Uncharacterized protein PRO82_000599 [Candidatus Protochlamydia amoebophila]|nr:Uncharacterized protein [Candidatus Protochlamydia amoebophila]